MKRSTDVRRTETPRCPKCGVPLARTRGSDGIAFTCPKCRGKAVALTVLRNQGAEAQARFIWKDAKSTGALSGKRCPFCSAEMGRARLPRLDVDLNVGVCTTCRYVWFDKGIFEQLPHKTEAKKGPQSDKAKEAAAMAALRVEKTRSEAFDAEDGGAAESWHWFPGLLGLPVEKDAPAISCTPWATWGLSAVIVAMFALTAWDIPAAADQWGLIPAEMFRHGGLTFVTCFFLHGGIFHLIGNVYFLLILGDNCEDLLGPWKYLQLLVAATIVGGLAHIAVNFGSPIPCIGASGGISGVIAYYALRHPETKVGLLLHFWWHFHWVYIPAGVAFLMWVLLQAGLSFGQVHGFTNVAAMAHLGGAAVGVGAWAMERFVFARLEEERVRRS